MEPYNTILQYHTLKKEVLETEQQCITRVIKKQQTLLMVQTAVVHKLTTAHTHFMARGPVTTPIIFGTGIMVQGAMFTFSIHTDSERLALIKSILQVESLIHILKYKSFVALLNAVSVSNGNAVHVVLSGLYS